MSLLELAANHFAHNLNLGPLTQFAPILGAFFPFRLPVLPHPESESVFCVSLGTRFTSDRGTASHERYPRGEVGRLARRMPTLRNTSLAWGRNALVGDGGVCWGAGTKAAIGHRRGPDQETRVGVGTTNGHESFYSGVRSEPERETRLSCQPFALFRARKRTRVCARTRAPRAKDFGQFCGPKS